MQPDRDAPLSPHEALARLTDLLRRIGAERAPPGVVLAVSGGPDSLAMLALLGDARERMKDAGFVVSVATVDHGLRPESAAEAAHVACIAAAFGFEHVTLPWRGWTGRGSLQAAAREARYALLVEEARRRGAGAVVTAHTLDDQIETHLLARARGASGPGLAGMRDIRDLAPGVRLLRPFLGVAKRSLEAVLAPRGLAAAADPSNEDPRFARVRVRRAVAGLSRRERDDILRSLAASADLRRTADRALLDSGWAVGGKDGRPTDARGRLFGDYDRFRALTPEIAARLVARAVTAAGGALYPPPAAGAVRLAALLRSARPGFAATLNGCQIRLVGERLVFSREYGREGPGPLLAKGRDVLFDRRFDICLSPDDGKGRACRLVPFGHLGRGNEVERTLPVFLRGDGEIVSAHPAIAEKAGVQSRRLAATSRVEWRFLADLRVPSCALDGPAQGAPDRGGRGVEDGLAVAPAGPF